MADVQCSNVSLVDCSPQGAIVKEDKVVLIDDLVATGAVFLKSCAPGNVKPWVLQLTQLDIKGAGPDYLSLNICLYIIYYIYMSTVQASYVYMVNLMQFRGMVWHFTSCICPRAWAA